MSGLVWFLLGLGVGVGCGMAMYLGSGRAGARERAVERLEELLSIDGNRLRDREGRPMSAPEVVRHLFEER